MFRSTLAPVRVTARATAIAIVGVTVAAVTLAASSASAAGGASFQVIDFTESGYSVGAGAPATQNSWWQAQPADFSLVENDSFPAAGLPNGGRSLQFSNATISGGGAHLVSPTIEAAGEPATTAPHNTFEVEFTVASATGAVQDGLGVDVAIDGASRYGGVINMRHTPDGLQIGSYWVPADATGASLPEWRSAIFATVPATVPHTIKTITTFLEGQSDAVQVFVDGALVSEGSGVTTWEYYHNITGTGGDRSVDSLSFKSTASAARADGIGYTGGLPAVPGTAGLGLLFSGISYQSYNATPTAPPTIPATPSEPTPGTDLVTAQSTQPGSELTFEASGFGAFENVGVTVYSTPFFAGWFRADAFGVVRGTITLPSSLSPGAHTLQAVNQDGTIVAALVFTVALPNTGEGVPLLPLGIAVVLLLGGAAFVIVRAVRKRGEQG